MHDYFLCVTCELGSGLGILYGVPFTVRDPRESWHGPRHGSTMGAWCTRPAPGPSASRPVARSPAPVATPRPTPRTPCAERGAVDPGAPCPCTVAPCTPVRSGLYSVAVSYVVRHHAESAERARREPSPPVRAGKSAACHPSRRGSTGRHRPGRQALPRRRQRHAHARGTRHA